MVVLADRANIGDLGRAAFGKRFDVVELDLIFVVNRMVINKAIQRSISPLLCENRLLLGLSNLPFYRTHLRFPHEIAK
jgi:hypothetical protein